MISPDYRSRSGHVLHDEGWLSGTMFAHVSRQQPRVQIVDASGANTGHDRNRFALVEWALRFQLRSPHDKEQAKYFLHANGFNTLSLPQATKKHPYPCLLQGKGEPSMSRDVPFFSSVGKRKIMNHSMVTLRRWLQRKT